MGSRKAPPSTRAKPNRDGQVTRDAKIQRRSPALTYALLSANTLPFPQISHPKSKYRDRARIIVVSGVW